MLNCRLVDDEHIQTRYEFELDLEIELETGAETKSEPKSKVVLLVSFPLLLLLL